MLLVSGTCKPPATQPFHLITWCHEPGCRFRSSAVSIVALVQAEDEHAIWHRMEDGHVQ